MYILSYTDECKIQHTQEYDTRAEAEYYKKKFGGIVKTNYEISDIGKGLFHNTFKIETETPLKAAMYYASIYYPDAKIKVDNTNTGQLVVRSKKTSKVYNVIQ